MKTIDPIITHQRDVRRKIILPVLLPALLLVGMAVVLFVLAMTGTLSAQQITVISAILLIIFVLLPLALLLLILDALLLLMAFGGGSIQHLPQKPLAMIRDYTAQGAALAQHYSNRVTEPVIRWRARITQWRYLLFTPFGWLMSKKGTPDEE